MKGAVKRMVYLLQYRSHSFTHPSRQDKFLQIGATSVAGYLHLFSSFN